MLLSMGSQRVRPDWVTELNWKEGKRGKNTKGLLNQSVCVLGENVYEFEPLVWSRGILVLKPQVSLSMAEVKLSKTAKLNKFFPGRRLRPHLWITLDPLGLDPGKILWIYLNSKFQTYSSHQFSPLVVSDSLPPYGLQHIRLPCSSSTPGACSNSCPFSSWCHPTILSSVVPFSSWLQSSPASGSFPVSQFFALGSQRIETSASACPSNEYTGLNSFRIDWLDLLVVQGTLKNLLQHHSSKPSILRRSAFFIVQLSHPYITTGFKNHSFD